MSELTLVIGGALMLVAVTVGPPSVSGQYARFETGVAWAGIVSFTMGLALAWAAVLDEATRPLAQLALAWWRS